LRRERVRFGVTTVKQAGVVAWLIGIAALLGLAVWSGLDAVGHAFASVGWGILLVVLVRAVTVSVAGVGWWLLFPTTLRPPLSTCVLLRFLREAANVLLPLGQVGGDLLAAGLLTFRSAVRAALATASVIVDILVQAATQLLFAVLGLLVLFALEADQSLTHAAAAGLAIGALALVGFYLAQRCAGQRILRWAMNVLTGDLKGRVLVTIDAVYQELYAIYAARSALVSSSVVHMAGWLVGVAEVSIVFAFMGHPVSLAEALIIESLLHAIRGAAFAIPGALGAQEGGLVLLCAAFGIPADQAIALSLVKRAADLALGAPALLCWQTLEWRRLMPGTLVRARQPQEVVAPRPPEP
jgi:putative membrane protein